MRIHRKPNAWPLVVAIAATAISGTTPIIAQTVAPAPTSTVDIAIGRGRLINLPRAMTDLFVADDKIADVQVRSPTQLYIFGRTGGETTVYATAKNGSVVYSTTVRVGTNIDSVGQMLRLAMPDAQIQATPMNGLVLLTGTVAQPDDAAEAERLVQAYVGPSAKVLVRLKTATPLQVNLQVKFAEVSRTFSKNIGINLQTRDTTSGFKFGVSSGRSVGTIGNAVTTGFPSLDASAQFGLPAGSISLPFNPSTRQFVLPNTGSSYSFDTLAGAARTALGFAGKLYGLDILSALDLGERIGQVSTLVNPNLTALSGETGTFLAGGEFPILISQGLGAVSVEYKQYGVSLSYTPTVLSDGRISLRVKPEVSQLSAAGAVQLGGTTIPALTTRRAETTVELGSGQSFMIAGLLQNNHDNSIDKAPGLGDVPVLGTLFRSNAFQRGETELVIVVTPYLVKPVNANDIVLPTDGYKAPTDLDRVLLGKLGGGVNGGERPKPSLAPSIAEPAFGAVGSLPTGPDPAMPVTEDAKAFMPPRKGKATTAAPGFNLK